MGAHGPNIFDDDLALDVRGFFRDLLKRGQPPIEATATIQNRFSDVLGTEEESIFWLALAELQWQYGVLQPEMLQRVLQIVADGTDLARWDFSPQLRERRQSILVEFAKRLQRPNDRPKHPPRKKTAPPTCTWEVGEVIAYKLPSGAQILFRVVNLRQSFFEYTPVCELLDWMGKELPDANSIANIPIRRNKRYPSESLFEFPVKETYLARCHRLNLRLPIVMRYDGTYSLSLKFNVLPSELEEYFGMRVADERPNAKT